MSVGSDRQVLPVALAQLLEPLEQPAVDEDFAVPVSSRCFEPVTVRAAPRKVRVMPSGIAYVLMRSREEPDLPAGMPEEHRLSRR